MEWSIPYCSTNTIRNVIVRCTNVKAAQRKHKSYKYPSFQVMSFWICTKQDYKRTHQIERTEVSSSGFGRSPASITSSSNDHHSKLYLSRQKHVRPKRHTKSKRNSWEWIPLSKNFIWSCYIWVFIINN